MIEKYIYSFQTGDGKNKVLLGGKGANLCEMTQIGLNVPPGFVITTKACLDYLEHHQLPDNLMGDVKAHVAEVEALSGKKFGDSYNPLLVSVRSGSAISMPGMMDTILNLGLNTKNIDGTHWANRRYSPISLMTPIADLSSYSVKVALGIDDEKFDVHFASIKKQAGIKSDVGLNADHLQQISELFLQVVQEETGKPFPEDVYEQLELSIKAVFNSWMGRRAVDYRREFHITPQMANGTAVNVVAMVFGNMGNDCATGVGFTRNPGTGAK